MKIVYALLLAVGLLLGQTAPSPVDGTALPGVVVGGGTVWTRGGASPYALDNVVAFHVGQGSWYSYTDVTTPVIFGTKTQPVASIISTGGAWIPTQSRTGMVKLLVIVQAGFSMVQATSTASPAVTGTVGAAFRLRKTGNVYIMPYTKATNATTTSAVFQPGIQLLYAFPGKKN